MQQTERHNISPSWTISSSGDVGRTTQNYSDNVSGLLDSDIVQGLEIWKNNPVFLGQIFMHQADRLGFSAQEKQNIFSNISREDITSIIRFNTHNEGSTPMDSGNFGRLILKNLPPSAKNHDELLYFLFHTAGIIEIYPTRTDEIVHVYTVLHHEINHLLIMALYIFRSKQKNIELDNIVQKCCSGKFDEVTETLAWLDGGQAPMNLGIMDNRRIAKYVGWQEGGQYNLASPYESAKLRAYRIHTLQIKIHNLPDTTAKQYQDWCKKVREIIFLGIDQPEYLKLIDDYLNSVSSPKQARDQLLSLY